MTELVVKSEASFKRNLRTAALAYYDQRWQFIDFIQEMQRLLAFHYTQAWTEAEKMCGFVPEDRTDAHRQLLQSEVGRDLQSVYGLATLIEDKKAQVLAGTLTRPAGWEAISRRLDVWVNRYNGIRTLGETILCADKKLVWHIGRTEKHCEDCLNYEGKVYRASVWREAGAMPQSRRLSCGGFNCDCRLVPTDAPATPGTPRSPRGG